MNQKKAKSADFIIFDPKGDNSFLVETQQNADFSNRIKTISELIINRKEQV